MANSSDSKKIRTSNEVFINYKTEDPEPETSDYARIQGVENGKGIENGIFYRLIDQAANDKYSRGTCIATRIRTITNLAHYQNNLNVSYTYSSSSGVRPVISLKNTYTDEYKQNYDASDVRIEFRDAETKELLQPFHGKNKLEVTYKNKYYDNFSAESSYGIIYVDESITPISISSAKFWTYDSNYYKNIDIQEYYTEYTMYDYNYSSEDILTGSAGDVIVIYLKASITKERVYHEHNDESGELIDSVNKIRYVKDNYSSLSDKYNKGNEGDSISKDVFIDMFGAVKGIFQWKIHKDDSMGGLCYGRAATTAAFLRHYDSVSNFVRYFDDGEDGYFRASQLNNLFNEYEHYTLHYSVLDYIKYAFVYQFSSDELKEKKQNLCDLNGLVRAVEKSVLINGEPVTISLGHFKSNTNDYSLANYKDGHRVLAVGLSEDDTNYYIHIDDSNYNHELQTLIIKKDFSEWNYKTKGYEYSNCLISYSMPGEMVYYIGNLINKDNSTIVVDSNSNMIISSDAITSNNIFEVGAIDDGVNDTLDNYVFSHQYYTDSNSINLTSTKNNQSFVVSDCNSALSFKLPVDGTEAKVNVDDDSSNYINYNTAQNESAEISFMTVGENSKLITAKVTGITIGGEVNASETANGLNVTGLKSGTVTIFDNDENAISEKSFISSDGKVEITYDNTGEDNKLIIHTNDKNDDTSVCSCNCHKSGFMSFIWKFINFFNKLFKTNPVCSCGVKHY